MKKLLIALLLAMPIMAAAQSNVTTNERIAALKAEAEAKAKAAQEALKAAQEAEEAARLALEQAEKEAAQAEAERKAKEEAERIAKEEAEAQAAIAEAERIAREAEEQAAAAKARAEAMKARAEQLKQQGQGAGSRGQEVTSTPTTTTPAQTSTAPAQTKAAPTPSVSETIVDKQKQESASEASSLWSSSIKDEAVEDKAKEIEVKNAYLAADAVPEVDGMVRWTCDIDVPGKTAQQIYERMIAILNGIVNEKIQLERSKIAIANEQEHSIMATMQEWLTFTSNALSLDRTKMNYVLQAKCTDGHAQVTMDHITYNYDVQGKVENYKAENWISDNYAVNKKRTRMYPQSGKFRRKTIDRKDEIFNTIKSQLR